ncbi:Riboflavin biosynthesis protein ribd [Thalictrum thalictroides]|uniref:Riboflavin biosynthesis protein ribd n=1 Tax=Thalictrum thalictroides TaxID=46969 RepID=A0A7J6UR84_THATH|nr:Riboflavin biosynthesis protein ribd [Thalictrum thalictroides]
MPVRIVMSQALNLPEVANLWDVSEVRTIVATQRGARKSFQKLLASKGVEVVEFDILNPRDVMEYCYDRGYLSILWECGGTLSAPAISSGVIHQVFAFVAPKIIGGANAPSPVGELGMVEMSQALNLIDVSFEQTWDPYGAFSNFSPHPLRISDENGDYVTWPTVEHYYQAHKFIGVNDLLAKDCVEQIKCAKSPEEAARVGRKMQWQHPHLVRSDWETVKIDVMYRALKCKFSIYPHLNSMLLSTAGAILVEASPHDLFWGGGREGEGLNYLGRLLMQLRATTVFQFKVKLFVVCLWEIRCHETLQDSSLNHSGFEQANKEKGNAGFKFQLHGGYSELTIPPPESADPFPISVQILRQGLKFCRLKSPVTNQSEDIQSKFSSRYNGASYNRPSQRCHPSLHEDAP